LWFPLEAIIVSCVMRYNFQATINELRARTTNKALVIAIRTLIVITIAVTSKHKLSYSYRASLSERYHAVLIAFPLRTMVICMHENSLLLHRLHAYKYTNAHMCSRYTLIIARTLFIPFPPLSLSLSFLFLSHPYAFRGRANGFAELWTRPHRARRVFPIRNTCRNVRQCGMLLFFLSLSLSLACFGNAISCATGTRATSGHGIGPLHVNWPVIRDGH